MQTSCSFLDKCNLHYKINASICLSQENRTFPCWHRVWGVWGSSGHQTLAFCECSAIVRRASKKSAWMFHPRIVGKTRPKPSWDHPKSGTNKATVVEVYKNQTREWNAPDLVEWKYVHYICNFIGTMVQSIWYIFMIYIF